MTEIVVCGEALIDFVPFTQTEGTHAGRLGYIPYPGGSPFNAAKAAARALEPGTGRRVGFAGAVSTDFFGAMLRRDLSAAGVDLSLLQTVPLNTTSAFVDFSGGSPAYAFHNAGTANERFDPAAGPALSASTCWLHVGSVSLIDQPAADNIAAFAIAAAGERLLSVDPNVRAGMINDPACWRARLDRLIAAAALVKLSDEDLAYMAGPGGDAAAQAAALRAMGPSLVLVSEGARGVWALWSGGETRVPAPQVSVVDTVGAGDTLMGACLAWLVDHGVSNRRALDGLGQGDIETMLAFATRAAALNCTQAGCNPPDWQTVVTNT